MGWQVQVPKIGGCKLELANHNIWETLLVDQASDGGAGPHEGADGIDKQVARSEEVLAEIGRDQGVVVAAANRPGGADVDDGQPRRQGRAAGYRLSGRARRAIAQRRRAHRAWVELEGPARGELWQRYVGLRRVAKQAVRESMRDSWLRFVSRGAERLADNELREFWVWARQVMGRSKFRSSPVLIVGDEVTADPRRQLVAWSQ